MDESVHSTGWFKALFQIGDARFCDFGIATRGVRVFASQSPLDLSLQTLAALLASLSKKKQVAQFTAEAARAEVGESNSLDYQKPLFLQGLDHVSMTAPSWLASPLLRAGSRGLPGVTSGSAPEATREKTPTPAETQTT